MPFFFRHRRRIPVPSPVLQQSEPVGNPRLRVEEEDASSRNLLTMTTNHMIAFVLILYGLYAICRFGFGWDPARDPPPPTVTIHIHGITDDDAKPGLRGGVLT